MSPRAFDLYATEQRYAERAFKVAAWVYLAWRFRRPAILRRPR